ncbi:hypothetical protein E2C01_058457 [Portunus trituberculatus]|uniref:Uncharacterized protein n=1 Tax=Portunus trituberculatus TaxID=210409 RepID=A0A5B7H2Q3_PORTR|nr:hypothetical protein [Portunus trituberculatus]
MKDENRRTRGHSKKIMKIQCLRNIKKLSFSHKTVNIWNGLSEEIVTVKSVHKFKEKLGKCRKGDRVGFDKVDDDDAQDLLESHAESLSNDELIELDKASQEAEKEVDEEEEPVRGLDIKTLRECLGGIEKALETPEEHDPNPARSIKVAHDVEKSVRFIKKSMMKKQEKLSSPPSTRSSSQSDMPSLSHLPTLLQLALPQYPLSSNH